MGGDANFPQRSSSPLKRPASDLEQEPSNALERDVDMDHSATADSSDPSHMTGSSMSQVEQPTEPQSNTTGVSGQRDKEEDQPSSSDSEVLKDRRSHFSTKVLCFILP